MNTHHYLYSFKKCKRCSRAHCKCPECRCPRPVSPMQRAKNLNASSTLRYAGIRPIDEAQLTEWFMQHERDPCRLCLGLSNCTDHIHPLSRGGQHIIVNLQRLCASCNAHKGAYMPGDVWGPAMGWVPAAMCTQPLPWNSSMGIIEQKIAYKEWRDAGNYAGPWL